MIKELRESTRALQKLGMKSAQIDALTRHIIVLQGCSLADWAELELTKTTIVKNTLMEEPITENNSLELSASPSIGAITIEEAKRLPRMPLIYPPVTSVPTPMTTQASLTEENDPPEQKWCPGCKQLLPKIRFGKNNASPDRLMRTCKVCTNTRNMVLKTTNDPTLNKQTELMKDKIMRMPDIPVGRPTSWTRGNSMTVQMIAYKIGSRCGVTGRVLAELQREGKIDKTMIPDMNINGRVATNSIVYWKVPAKIEVEA